MYFLMPSDGKSGDLLWDKGKQRYYLVMSIENVTQLTHTPYWRYTLFDMTEFGIVESCYIGNTRAVTWMRIFPLDESSVSDKILPWRQL